jgi:plastocyanin
MRANAFYIATAILCVAACAKSSDSGSVAQGTSGYHGGTPTGPTYPSDTTNTNPAPASPNTINANPGLAFNPTSLTVTHGTSVDFVFGSVAHTVTFTSAGAPANVPATSNATVSVAFPTAGVYTYMCSIHPQMTGTVTVQ